jgi:hypothetical protein
MSKSISLIQDHKPTWTPTTTYDWDIKPPPSSSLPPSATNPTDIADGPVPEPTAEPTPVDADSETPAADDDAELPPSTFNPLLYRALTGLATTLAPPPEQGQPPGQDATAAAEQATGGATDNAPEVNGNGQGGEGKEVPKGIRVGPKGLRKPKGAI